MSRKVIKITSKKLAARELTSELNSEINSNFQELYDSVGSISAKTITVDIDASEYQSIIPGDTFTPPITTEPTVIQAKASDGETSVLFHSIINGYTQNGDYYDIIIAPLTESMSNVTISVI